MEQRYTPIPLAADGRSCTLRARRELKLPRLAEVISVRVSVGSLAGLGAPSPCSFPSGAVDGTQGFSHAVCCTWVFTGIPGSHRSSGRSDKVRSQVKGADVLGVGWKGQPEVRPAEEAVLASRAETPVQTCCVTLSLTCGSSYLSLCEAQRW